MAEIDVVASSWKTVEVGRVVLFVRGTYEGRLAAIVEIVDHKRVCSNVKFHKTVTNKVGPCRWSFQR